MAALITAAALTATAGIEGGMVMPDLSVIDAALIG